MCSSFISVDEEISYFPAGNQPLSADVFCIRRGDAYFLFDVGNSPESLKACRSVPNAPVVLSHFHADHCGNIVNLTDRSVFLSAETEKHTGFGRIVREETEIADGLSLRPLPNSHEKGSLLAETKRFLLVGDALYPKNHHGTARYTVSLLREEILLFGALPQEYLLVSHQKNPVFSKKAALRFLTSICDKRQPGEPFIYTDMPVFEAE